MLKKTLNAYHNRAICHARSHSALQTRPLKAVKFALQDEMENSSQEMSAATQSGVDLELNDGGISFHERAC